MILNRVDLFFYRLDEISGAASKEFGLEKAMEKMKVEWKDMYFELIPYRDTVSYFLHRYCSHFHYRPPPPRHRHR